MMPHELNWSNPYPSARTPVFGRSVVATSQPLAAAAGIRMLLAGGNAVDAALATAIALTVVEPTMNGIGGDAFALVWDGGKVYGLNATGRAPRAWNLETFSGLSEMPAVGWGSVTVPGAVSGWVELSRRFGVLPFAELFGPALEYARRGYPVTPLVARTWSEASVKYRTFKSFVDTFLPDGRAPRPGERFTFAAAAGTLEEIADTFGESFYRGRLAAAIARFARETGGVLDEEDLGAHHADWVEPMSTDFDEFTVHEMPPNSQGMAALLALALLGGSGVSALDPDSPESVDLQVCAMRTAHEEVRARVADPDRMSEPGTAMLAEDRLQELRHRMMCRPNAPGEAVGDGSGDTVYLTTADSNRMMVSYIQSNYYDFGSGLVVPGTGISLHSRAACFSLDPRHPNVVAGGCRPFHTLCPAFVSSAGRPVMSLGVMGGHMQPQGHVQTLLRILVHGWNPQAACDAPRWHVAPDGLVLLESGFPERVRQKLALRGHRVEMVSHGDPVFGGGQFALVLPSGYCAASDPRKDGQALAI